MASSVISSVAHSIVLDATALSCLAQRAPATQPWERFAVRTGSTFYVCAATLAGVCDGTPRDANVRRVIHTMCKVEPVTESIGLVAGQMRSGVDATRRKKRDLTVDALVAATASTLRYPVVVLTGDQDDLTWLLQDTGVKVHPIKS